jgi:hypothetical protein
MSVSKHTRDTPDVNACEADSLPQYVVELKRVIGQSFRVTTRFAAALPEGCRISAAGRYSTFTNRALPKRPAQPI